MFALSVCVIKRILRGSLLGVGLAGVSMAPTGCGGGGSIGGTTPPPVSNPALRLSASSFDFGSVPTGATSTSQTLTLTDSGSAVLNITGITATGDYSLGSNGCAATLAVSANCQVTIQFKPTAAGARTGTLAVTTNAAGSPASVTLSGVGVTPVVYTGSSFGVIVMAGTFAVTGADVKLYATGSTGNGSAGMNLLAVTVTTDATGNVTVPATYSCPSASAQVYLLATGGQVAGATGANLNLLMMTAVGRCDSITAATKLVVNEVTSVAAVFALAPFYAAGGAVGASATNLTGLTNAFATAGSLANPTTGTAPGATLPANAASPAARVDAVANLLHACTASAAACGTLYSATTGMTAPANTLDALFNLVKNPAANVASLYRQSLVNQAFKPALTAVPADFTMFINYTAGGLNSPSGIAVDSTGSVWVANYFSVASKFTPVGAPVFANGVTGAGLYNSYGIAIDLNDNAWIPNEQPVTPAGTGSVSELSPTGTSLAGPTGYLNGGLNFPLSVAIDPNGTVWVVDYGNSHLTLLNSMGLPLSGANGFTTSLFAFPVAVAIDGNHFGWIANQSGNTVTKASPDGLSFTNYTCCSGASGLAIDQGNNVWVANFYGDSVSLISSNGTVTSAGYTGNGALIRPQGIAVDGAGNVWVANYRQSYLVELAGANSSAVGKSLSPATGLGSDAGLLEAYALAVDASGNIWVSNQGNNMITKYVGMAAPVKTPLSALPKAP